ncbi:hypothetical protein [Candidatus Phytoplasma oryzae]|nr:hypothetical protein PIE28_02050 [Candidatus Phytoplasma oryzae]
MLDKKPHFRNIEIFNLVLEKEKSSKVVASLEPINIEKIISPKITYEYIISQSHKACGYGIFPNFIKDISDKKHKEQDVKIHMTTSKN